MDIQDVFCEIPCLTENSKVFSGISLQKKWFKNADKRVISSYLQKFIEYNKSCFDFLGVFPAIIGTDANASLRFRTTNFIGSIPLRAPDTGKQIGDFVITPKYISSDRYSEYIEILNILKKEISPEVIDSLPLVSGRNFQPPLYLEALKFIQSLSKLVKSNWTKFERIEKILDEPRGQLDWNKYISNQYKAENILRFPSALNVRSEYHKEYAQIRYVFDISKKEILSPRTPQSIKCQLAAQLKLIEEKLYFHKPVKTAHILIRSSDSMLVKETKYHANKIINDDLKDSTAWRVDFSNVFEKLVQYIFTEVAKEAGGKISTNFRITGSDQKNLSWSLKYLEPDAVYQKDSLLVMIDAKYKSHLYNKHDLSDILKDDHRRDLHQILGYSSFNTAKKKYSFLCYPSDEVEIHHKTYNNSINYSSNKVIILGIPLRTSSIKEVQQRLIYVLSNLDQRSNLAQDQ